MKQVPLVRQSDPAGDVRLAGTFAAPSGDEPVRAALLINGSGPLDRDGNFKGQRLNISRDLAELLAGNGCATLRFDEMGRR